MVTENKHTNSSLEFTDEQWQAIDHFGSNVFVNAGAGSGKTRILVARYIEILRRGFADIEEIVAITFTRKAAGEMKRKIRDHLVREVTDPDLVHELETAPISTIHGFCARLLRENATRVGIDPGFRVLEEIEEIIFRENGIQDAVMKAIHRGDDRIIGLVGRFGLPDLLGLFKKIYVNRGSMAEWIDYYSGRSDPPAVEKDLLEWSESRLEIALRDPLLNRSIGVLENNRSSDPEDRIEKLRREVLSLVNAIRSGPGSGSKLQSLETLIGLNLGGGRQDAWDAEDLRRVKEAIKGIRNLFKGVFEEVRPLPDGREDRFEGLVKTLMEEYLPVERDLWSRKQAESLLDYDDLLLITRQVLREDRDLRTRLREKYRFFLVDEFQDTDHVQWEILRLLTSPPGESGGDRLFLVGDFGQSIYRFRGAEVQVFSRAGQVIRGEGGREFSLTRNFRSTPSLISFVNFFQRRVEEEEIRATDEPKRIFLRPFRDHDTGEPPVELVVVAGETGVDREMCRRAEADRLAKKIRQVVESESRDFGDVAVLFRSMTYAWIYEMAMRSEGIPYSLIKGGRFFGLQEVRDVINALKAIDDEGDEIALVGLLRSPFFGVSDDAIYGLCMNDHLTGNGSTGEGITGISSDDKRVLDHVEGFLREARGLSDATSLYDLISWLFEKSLYREVLLGLPGGERKVLNVNKLLQIAQAVESKRSFSLGDFIRFIDRVTFQELRESEAPVELDDAGAVRILSIHSAKGLEFPVVILPDLLWQRGTESPMLIHHPAYGFAIRGTDREQKKERSQRYRAVTFVNHEEDRREWTRLFYVAMTRARDKLILSVSMPSSTSPMKVSSTWVRWIRELLPMDIRSRFEDDTETAVDDEIRDICRLTHHICGEEESTISGEESPAMVTNPIEPIPSLSEDIWNRIKSVEPEDQSRRLTVTQLLDYMDCPRLYFLRHVLGCPDVEGLWTEPSAPIAAPSVGEILHRVLEIWNLDSGESLTNVIRSQVAGEAGDTGGELKEKIATLLGPFRESELIEELRAARDRGALRREWSFSILVGGIPVTGSVDAIFDNGKGDTVIVDYKTIEVDDVSQIRTLDRFERQVRLYAQAYRSITEICPREGIIYFMPTGYSHRMDLSPSGEFEEYVRNSVARLEQLIVESDTGKCTYCDMKRICR